MGRTLGFAALTLLCATSPSAASATAPQGTGAPRPNIVIITADDLGYGDLGCYGSPDISTPRIDQMAAEGLRSTAFYVARSCSPTRAALLTGSHSARVDVISPMGPWSDLGLSPSEYTLAEMLRDAGYSTAHFGKWHLGDSPDQLPEGQGFDESLSSVWGLPARPHLLVDTAGAPITDSDPVTWTPLFVDRTLAFIDGAATAGTPFFVVLDHTSPHEPATPSPGFVGQSADGREYGDSVEEIDASVGRILDRIDGLGLRESTLVLFFSDNGPALKQSAYQAGSAGPLRAGKGTTFEGGVRVPLVARWPSQIPAGVTSGALMHAVDAFDTFATLAGATLPAGLPPRDGRDVGDVLLGGPGDPLRAVYHFSGFNLEAVRQGRWKLRREELFDLDVDIGEQVDLAAVFPQTAQALRALRDAKEADVIAGIRPRSLTQRQSPLWRANAGLPAGTVDGGLWNDRLARSAPWRFVDADPAVDLALVPTGGAPPQQLPPLAIQLAQPTSGVRLERPGADLGVAGPGAAFSLEFWLRSESDDPASDAVLFDAGDAQRGVSITLGDGGIRGDDPAPGRRDDMRVRFGGSASLLAATLTFDLPSGGGGWSDAFTHLAICYDVGGRCTAWVNGFPRAVVLAPDIDAGLDGDWSLFDRSGPLGGDAGIGVLPFDGVSFLGEVATVRAYDRALSRKEVELAVCRHVVYAYCAPEPDASGARPRFALRGDFRPATRDLRIELSGVAPGTLGRLLASREQTRLPARGGYLCVQRRIALEAQPLLTVAGSPGPPVSSFAPLGEFAFDAEPGSSWNFQLWIRESGELKFTNALRVLFCP